MNDIRKMAMFRIHEFIEYDMISGGDSRIRDHMVALSLT